MTPTRRLLVSSTASSLGIVLGGFVVQSPAAPAAPALLRTAAANRVRTTGTFEVSDIAAASGELQTGLLPDPTSVPRYVPEAWVAELRSIRNIERPGSFEGYYDQE